MKKKSVFTAAAIVAGNGIGSGVMAIPYFIDKAGVTGGLSAFAAAYLVSVCLHLMIAQILLMTGDTADILGAFNRFLFKGRFRNVWQISFFVIMVIVLETNLAAYISGASSITAELLPGIPVRFAGILFYLIAAMVVLFGLRAVCISEKTSVSVMGIIVLAAVFFSVTKANHTLSFGFAAGGKPALSVWAATFSMIMFSFSAIFAVPQVIEYLERDVKKVRKSIYTGLLMNLILSVVVSLCAVITSKEVTKVAIVGWAEAVGGPIRILGSLFILLAMFTSYWSIGFATTEIIATQTKKSFGLSFILGTVPALLLTLVLSSGFLEYMKIAGGAVAVIISLMVIPTYLICTKGKEQTVMNRVEASKAAVAVVFVMYLVMAVGSLITV
jgi:amino acid permease